MCEITQLHINESQQHPEDTKEKEIDFFGDCEKENFSSTTINDESWSKNVSKIFLV
jgi:hypothetical protein